MLASLRIRGDGSGVRIGNPITFPELFEAPVVETWTGLLVLANAGRCGGNITVVVGLFEKYGNFKISFYVSHMRKQKIPKMQKYI